MTSAVDSTLDSTSILRDVCATDRVTIQSSTRLKDSFLMGLTFFRLVSTILFDSCELKITEAVAPQFFELILKTQMACRYN